TRVIALFFHRGAGRPALHSFPTRRSSDLSAGRAARRSRQARRSRSAAAHARRQPCRGAPPPRSRAVPRGGAPRRESARPPRSARSEEHTSELQSLAYLVCRLLLEKKKHAS